MNDTIRNEIEALDELRVPELQSRYETLIGERTRCPNRRWLIRRIAEAMTTGQDESVAVVTPVRSERAPLRALSVEELRARHLEVIGRPTGSTHLGYLRWRLRQAERGKIRVGAARREPGTSIDLQVLPLRMSTGVVAQLDEARRRLGLASRAELFRRALHRYFLDAGEGEVAGLFLRDGAA